MSRAGLLVLAGEQAGRLAAQDRQIAALAAQVADLTEANEQLAAKLAKAGRLLSRNSGNSSMPPSTDDLPGRPSARDRRSEKAACAGRASSQGRRVRAWPGARTPDETIAHFPDGTCECGADLAAGRDLGVAASHQQAEIPLAMAKVIQHDLHEVACGCGRVRRAARPERRQRGRVSYGPNLQAWCVYLMVAHAIPVHRCAELIESLTGAEPSPGSCTACSHGPPPRSPRAKQADPGAGHLVVCGVR